MQSTYEHKSVLAGEVLEYLNLKAGDTIVDCTIGLGGHSLAILKLISPGGTLIGIDCDEEALEIANENLKIFSGSYRLVYANFKNIDELLADLKIKLIDGLLFDLGVSSLQLDMQGRGFSFRFPDSALDMRMDKSNILTAKDIVNNYTEFEIDKILQAFGEERYHRRIAKKIVSVRKRNPINTIGQLVDVVTNELPYKKFTRIHPATRTFQALRIAVNRELEYLKEGIEKGSLFLKPGSRICVISYHSLEDRIVKNTFKEFSNSGMLKILTKKPIIPQEEETRLNPRSRSAKLRVAERA